MFGPFKGKFVCDMDSLAKRPALAARVAKIIAMWSLMELSLSQLLSMMLQADAQVGATLFSVIKAEGGRLAMLRAISEDRLSPELQAEYAALQKRIATTSGYRDAMAHGTWAAAEDDPNCLVLVDPRHVAAFIAGLTASLVKKTGLDAKSMKSAHKYREDARRYTTAEFDFLEAEIKQLQADVNAFGSKVIAASA